MDESSRGASKGVVLSRKQRAAMRWRGVYALGFLPGMAVVMFAGSAFSSGIPVLLEIALALARTACIAAIPMAMFVYAVREEGKRRGDRRVAEILSNVVDEG